LLKNDTLTRESSVTVHDDWNDSLPVLCITAQSVLLSSNSAHDNGVDRF